jgi:mono/diheme cytochrome c family protein
MRIMKIKTCINQILSVSFLFVSMALTAQSDWMVSEEKQKTKNPIVFSQESVKAGKIVYNTNCKSCHGDPTKNNGLPLMPKPTDMGLQAFLDKNTDGSIFYKITEGRVTMPQYASILSEEDRWHTVNYIRSFDANFEAPTDSEQSTVQTDKDGKEEFTAPYELSLNVNQSSYEVTAVMKGTRNGQLTAMKDAEVFLGIKRYFSNLPIMEPGAATDENGMIKTEYPIDLPGNEEGKGYVVAYPVDKDKYGDVLAEAEINLEAIDPVDFASIRALWHGKGHAPIWLIVTYLSLILIVWGTMFKVVMNIFKLKKIGSQ